jgi:hypothetical protein
MELDACDLSSVQNLDAVHKCLENLWSPGFTLLPKHNLSATISCKACQKQASPL